MGDQARDTGADTTPAGPSEDVAWSMVSTLVAGPVAWALIGWAIDTLVGTSRVFVPIGLVIGFITSFYVIFVRYGRD